MISIIMELNGTELRHQVEPRDTLQISCANHAG
jgi:hypothetical protein